MSNTTPPPTLYDTLPLQKQSFVFTNIITNDTYDIELYPDDTNLTVLNKLCVKLNILTDEICAYVNDYKLIGFSYDNINIKQIFNKNKIDLSKTYLDENFVDKIGNKISVYKNNLMNELFEENFTSRHPADKNIYYFTLNDLKKLKPEIFGDDKFIYSVVYKYFPNIKKDYIDNYQNKSNSDLRKNHIKKINKLLSSNSHYLDILDNNVDNLLNEDKFTSTLLNFKCINIENNINIIKLFSDYELSSERFYTKLILEDYNKSFFKLYKPELKLPHSDESNFLKKDICGKLLNDFSDNMSLPYEFGEYMPPSIQPRNCIIFKTYLKSHTLFYSFILFMNGNYDFIINNYNDINIDDDILKELNKDINTLIGDINRPRIYTINEIPELIKYDDKICFINSKIEFSIDKFRVKGDSIYEKSNLLKYLSNFYTHIRIVKEKMDLDPDTIIFKYKRVSNYEKTNPTQSIINVLHDPNIDIPLEEFIEIISKNTGISIEEATLEHQKWSEMNEKNKFKKNAKTTETGAEIRIIKYREKYIHFTIYNVQSREELNRIIQFIKIFMELYKQFINNPKPKCSKIIKDLFTKDIDKNEIDDIEEEHSKWQFIEDLDPSGMHSSQEDDSTSETDSSSSDSEYEGIGGSKIGLPGGYHVIENLKGYDDKLFSKNSEKWNYPGKCQASLFRVPIPLHIDELERLEKYDILKTVKNPPLTQNEIWEYITENTTVADLKKVLHAQKILYSEKFPSFSKHIKQPKIGNEEKEIYYICPKYWDISKRVSIHPRDIYDRLDDIIPPKFKGETEKHIMCMHDSTKYFNKVKDKKIKEIIINFLKCYDIYNLLVDKLKNPEHVKKLKTSLEDSMLIIESDRKGPVGFMDKTNPWFAPGTPCKDTKKDGAKNIKDLKEEIEKRKKKNYDELIDLDMKSFNDRIIKKVPEIYYNLLHQQIVEYIKPSFLPDVNVDGFSLPCCGQHSKKIPKLDKDNISITDLTPSNINKFAHIHPHLQTLFGFKKEFHDNKRHLGGFIKFGVQQNNNSLINVLSNFYNNDNDDIDFKTKILIKSLTDENSLLTFMKCGDGNIVQLFKSSKYNINDIEYFLNYIKEPGTIEQLKKININNSELGNIKEHFKKYGMEEMEEKDKSGFDKYESINKFKGLIYKSDINIKFIYDLIISKNNFIKYLNSNEIKDYKYILPLMSEIKKDHIYILFENNDDIINIRLPLNTYDIYEDKNKDKYIFNFIYKVGDIYEPIYYFKDKDEDKGKEKNKKKDKHSTTVKGRPQVLCCDIKYYMHEDDGKINDYINLILDNIRKEINDIDLLKSLEYFSLVTLIPELKPDNLPDKLLVDPYCKVSHVITKKGYIYPIIPSKIIDGYELIYSFETIPSFEEYLQYGNEEIIKEKFKVKGFILNDKNNIINIVFKNNTYIPIKEEVYDKTNKHMRRRPILGYKDLFIIDKDLQNFTKETDDRYKFTSDTDYRNYITNLAVQNIIYYIKNTKYPKDYYTNEPEKYNEDVEYVFKLNPKKVPKWKPEEGKLYVEKDDKPSLHPDYFYDENKFLGTVIKKGNDTTTLTKLEINVTLLDELYLIINNGIHTNFTKQTKLFDFIKKFTEEIIIELSDDEYEKYKNNTDISICFKSNDKCLGSCEPDKSDNDKCKLYVKKSDIPQYGAGKSLINKIIYKFIDLLLIHKDIDKISSLLQENININDLYKSAKNDEIFFNYLQYQNKYINELFKSESSFIRNINFYDRENTYLNQSRESKPIKSIIKGVPYIIKKIFPYSNVLTYIDENNLDFKSLEYSFKEIYTNEISSEKLKSDIFDILNQHKSPDNTKLTRTHYSKYDNDFRNASHLTNIEDIIENIKKKQYKINPFDLHMLSLKSPDIGFLLISSKYSNEKTLSKLKHTILLKYHEENKNKDTKFILLYHFLNEDGEYDLANIVFKNNESDDGDGDDVDGDQYKSYLSLDELLKIPDIKTIIENDYPDLI